MGSVRQLVFAEDIPHEPGQWMKFVQLGWADRKAARREQTRNSFADLAEMPEKLFKLFGDVDRGTGRVVQALTEQYDMAAVLRAGIVEWSYAAPVSPASIDQLDERTADWAFHRILGETYGGDDPLASSSPSTSTSTDVDPSPTSGSLPAPAPISVFPS